MRDVIRKKFMKEGYTREGRVKKRIQKAVRKEKSRKVVKRNEGENSGEKRNKVGGRREEKLVKKEVRRFEEGERTT